MLATNSSFAIASAAFSDLPYDNIKDFAPITLLDKHPYLLLVNAGSQFKNLSDYLAYARANPDKLNYSTSGAGSVTHLSGALLHTMSNTRVTYIHFKSAAQRILDVVAGRIDASMTAPITAVPLMNAGKLRAIGITTDHRIPLLPDLPTIAEQGVPGFEFTSWIGTFAPAGVPAPVLNRLNQLWVATTKDPKVIKKLEADGTIMGGNTSAEFSRFVVAETNKWKKIIKDTGIQVSE
jgi:tripartite-type tricarboxylate transporter receptor subunit TctC